ncbi:hypothetical protein KUCAC02_012030, partial [Chaenocephalus aceratus]
NRSEFSPRSAVSKHLPGAAPGSSDAPLTAACPTSLRTQSLAICCCLPNICSGVSDWQT